MAACESGVVDNLMTLKPDHPRLLIGKDEIKRIRKIVDTNADAGLLMENLKHKAEQYLKEPTVPFIPSDDGNFLKVSRTALKRISTLAGLYLISRDRRYFEKARDELVAIASLKDWNPAHFLDVAEMTCAMAIGYDWLFDELSREEKRVIKTAIVNCGIKAGLNQFKTHKWWTCTPYNWNIVCNGGLLVGALAVADEEPELANRVINCARMSVPYAMASFEPDGGWPEGPSYWCYCTRYAMFMLASLDSALGHDFGWLESPGFSSTGDFRIHVTSPAGEYFNFADSSSKMRKAPQMFWLAEKFNKPVYAYSEMKTAKALTDIFHLLYFPSRIKTYREIQMKKAALFKGINTGFYRSSWEDPNALFLGFKGGSNCVGHAHLDLGTFVLDWFSKRWAVELGPDNYSLPGYFDRGRWNYFRLKTEGQNCLVIDGENQNVDAVAPVVQFKQKEGFLARVDLSQAYEKQVEFATRTFRVSKGKQGIYPSITVTDRLKLKGPKELSWNMFTKADASISDDGKSVCLSYPDVKEKVLLYLNKPETARFSTALIQLSKPERDLSSTTRISITLKNADGLTEIQVRVEARVEAQAETQVDARTNLDKL